MQAKKKQQTKNLNGLWIIFKLWTGWKKEKRKWNWIYCESEGGLEVGTVLNNVGAVDHDFYLSLELSIKVLKIEV